MNPGKIHLNRQRPQSAPPLDRYGQCYIPAKAGNAIEYQERGSRAVDVYEGLSRNLSRVNGKLLARALLFYVPNETLTPTRRRAIGDKTDYMKRYLSFLTYLLLVIFTSCANSKNDSNNLVEFETFSGEVNGPKTENMSEPITVSYSIVWPTCSDKGLESTLRKWIISQISRDSRSYTEGLPPVEVVNSILTNLSKKVDDYCDRISEDITVSAETDSPFEGYLTISAQTTVVEGMGMPSIDETRNNITVRLSDGIQFNHATAISDKEGFRKAIAKSVDFDWDKDIMYFPINDIPLPTYPLMLTKEGIQVYYEGGVLCRAFVGTIITVPYSDAIPTLSESAINFLPNDLIETSQNTAQQNADIEKEATKFLYHTFYNKDALSGEISNVGSYSLGYSDQALKKFKELGIESELDYAVDSTLADENNYYKPYYSNDLNRLLKKVSEALNNTDNFELFILMGGEFTGEEDAFNLSITNMEIVSPGKAIVKATENPNGDEKTYILIKQDGRWYIDDIYDYRSKAKTILGKLQS